MIRALRASVLGVPFDPSRLVERDAEHARTECPDHAAMGDDGDIGSPGLRAQPRDEVVRATGELSERLAPFGAGVEIDDAVPVEPCHSGMQRGRGLALQHPVVALA
jgi:hypothetical protein